jgi:hypothetical protein
MMLTYAIADRAVVSYNSTTRRRSVRHVATKAMTGVVWSPGPLPETVWVLPYSGAPSDEAVAVRAPSLTRPYWHRVERPTRGASRSAPELARATWFAALGVDSVEQLAIEQASA